MTRPEETKKRLHAARVEHGEGDASMLGAGGRLWACCGPYP